MKATTRLIITSLLCIVLIPTDLFAQNPYPDHTNCERQMKEAGQWYFGVYAGVNFNSGDALAETSQPNAFKTPICPAVVSDSAGNLMFMTNGKQIFNMNFDMIGDGLYGHYSCSQPAIVIPKPDDPYRYYVITSDSYRNINGDQGLNYTEVSMNANSYQGLVVALNTNLIPSGMDGRLSAVKHANGKDFWLISHKWGSNEFCSFRITAGGVDDNYVSSSLGSIHDGDNNLLGFMKASPDGSRLAVTQYERGTIEFFNFNNENGQVSAAISSPADYYGAYGLEFSQDNSKAYITTLDYANIIPAFPSEIIQFDLESSDIFGTATHLHASTDGFRYAALQLGNNGRIYMAKSINATTHSDFLGVVFNPNRAGTNCNFNSLDATPDTEFSLGGRQSFWGLPNVVQSFVDWPHFTYDSICIGDVTIFNLTNKANVETASWDFKDPAGSSNTADELRPTHQFSATGQYQVEITETFQGNNYTYTESLTVYPSPDVAFPLDTIYIFEGDNVNLTPGSQYAAYLWSTGATSNNISVSDPGQYWVRVQNEQCCFNVDSVVVVLYELYVPNAFRPASTINSEFKPVVPVSAVQDYRMQIYDRWGKLIFESSDIGTGWDGEINNQAAPFGVYAWKIDYKTVDDDGTKPVKASGTVMLLR